MSFLTGTCQPGMIKLPLYGEQKIPKCHAVLNSTQTMTLDEALKSCMTEFKDANLPMPEATDQLQALIDFAIQNGLDTTKKEGFWIGVKRWSAAPVEPDGTLLPMHQAIRKNATLFFGNGHQFNASLWREGQPGDKTDERDEQCAAQTDLGKPWHFGVDDYMCHGREEHYCLCEGREIVFGG